jgi:hypothetical protein
MLDKVMLGMVLYQFFLCIFLSHFTSNIDVGYATFE